ncbi:MAG: tetratricopeptide repeat protein, partial [Pseudomonadota bacterium]
MLSQFIHAARSLARDYAAHAATRIVKLDEARAVAGAGDPRRAITMLQLLRKQTPQDAAILEELAKTLIVSGDTQTAATVLLDALRTSPDTPALHHLMGSLLRQGVREALVADYWLLAFQLAAPTTPDAAIPLLTDRAGKAPLSAQSLLQLGHCLAACNQLPAATTQYQRALALVGITTRVLAALAGVYQLQGMTSDASRYRGMAHYQNSDYADAVAALDGIAIASGDTAAIEALAWSLIKTDNYQRAVDVCAAACASQPSAAELYRPWLWALRYLDRTSEAMAIAADAAARQQDPLFLLQERLLLLPPVFHSSVQLQQNYQRFLQGLTEFETLTAALDGEAARELLDSLSPNFELAYLGVDVSIPLQRFGRVLQRLAATAYPQWSALRHPDAANAQRRLRIGYVSAHFHIHSASLLAYGWLTSHTREQFEVFAYHVGDKRDVLTGRLAQECEHFVHVGNRLEAVCTQITNDQLDILIYVDIGMEMLTSIMASLRLAPLQCATWAHPIATGLPC